jgi:hypothetical protein
MARESERPSDELVEFDDLESGRVKPIDGEEAYRRLMETTDAQRQRHRPA